MICMHSRIGAIIFLHVLHVVKLIPTPAMLETTRFRGRKVLIAGIQVDSHRFERMQLGSCRNELP